MCCWLLQPHFCSTSILSHTSSSGGTLNAQAVTRCWFHTPSVKPTTIQWIVLCYCLSRRSLNPSRWWQVLVHRSLREPLDPRHAVTKRHQPGSGDPKGPDINHPLKQTVNKTGDQAGRIQDGFFQGVWTSLYIQPHVASGCERIFWPRSFFYEISILSIIPFQNRVPPE